MRKIILYCVMGVMLIVVIFSCITVHGRGAREDELEQGLSEAIEATINALFVERTYSISNQEEFVADFLQGLMMNMESTSELTVNILAADAEKGLLSVEVLETYTHPNGNTGTVSAYRTVIFDTESKEDIITCNVRFYLSKSEAQSEDGSYGQCYKIYNVPKGSSLALPKNPEETGKTFQEWRTMDGSVLNEPITVQGDISAYAVFR